MPDTIDADFRVLTPRRRTPLQIIGGVVMWYLRGMAWALFAALQVGAAALIVFGSFVAIARVADWISGAG